MFLSLIFVFVFVFCFVCFFFPCFFFCCCSQLPTNRHGKSGLFKVWGHTVYRGLMNWVYGIFMLKVGYLVYHSPCLHLIWGKSKYYVLFNLGYIGKLLGLLGTFIGFIGTPLPPPPPPHPSSPHLFHPA